MDCVIQYCSSEADLVDDCVHAACEACARVYLVVLTHFFTGEEDPEAWTKARQLQKLYSNLTPILVQWKPMQVPPLFWHHEARLAGYAAGASPWVLFLDADEVLRDAKSFRSWFQTSVQAQTEANVCAYKLANYWYFLTKQRRAKTLEDSVVLVQRQSLHLTHFRQYKADRENYFFAVPESRRRNMVLGVDGKPMVDHFSWVRSKDVLLKKSQTWGHRGEKDWKKLIEDAFASDLLTTPDFVHGYEYEILDP